ncbi:MAG: hypothetical protein ACP5NO_02140 [Thermoplasmata archaeon]
MVSDSESRHYEVICVNKKYRVVNGELKLLISFHNIEFSNITKGYYRIAKNIFMSALPFLLYVKKVTTNPPNCDFETVKGRAKLVLLDEMKHRKRSLTLLSNLSEFDPADKNDRFSVKIKLLDQAISILEEL